MRPLTERFLSPREVLNAKQIVNKGIVKMATQPNSPEGIERLGHSLAAAQQALSEFDCPA